MEKNNIAYFGEKFNQLQTLNPDGFMGTVRKEGFNAFSKAGLPTRRNEEWKYTSISDLFKKEYHIPGDDAGGEINPASLDGIRLPGYENANELVFVNGRYSAELSTIRSSEQQLVILPLEEAAKGAFAQLVGEHLGKSDLFVRDGIHALNTSFIYGGIFICVNKNQVLEHPVYLYHLSDTSRYPVLAQPRSLVIVEESARLQMVETYQTTGAMDSFTNEVVEVVVGTNAIMEYYKIQNDAVHASQVGTTHIRQIGKSYVHTVVVTLNGAMIRNNTNIIMEEAGNEAHMYGLYLLKGASHVDNHTLVDNTRPNCFSNELYKGVMDQKATGVFSGKIFVRPDAQKTNAYQSNKNILLGDEASVNTKPQLEIFADDVKCSHGCTVGRLDEEALFYLRTRGISKEHAQAMLLQAFASDVVEQIKIEPLRQYTEALIERRLSEGIIHY
jgi:Fe-S cluster assembly protein SufD